MSDSKRLSHERFSRYAQRYVESSVHAAQHELDLLVELAEPRPDWRVLDVATGGGHTALAFAPRVREVIAYDLSVSMLTAARRYLDAKGATNTRYIAGDAEHLPFAPNTFDLITCRVAVHHFPDAYRFMVAAQRALKPNGLLLIQDHVQPESERDAQYLEAFERLRDPSHHRAFGLSEWRGLYLDAGLSVEYADIIKKEANFLAWAQRQDCTPQVIERLTVLLAQAPQVARDWIEPHAIGTADATFKHVYVVIGGRKSL